MHMWNNIPLDKRFLVETQSLDSTMEIFHWTNSSYCEKKILDAPMEILDWTKSSYRRIFQMHICKCSTGQNVFIIENKIFTCIYRTFHQTKGSYSGKNIFRFTYGHFLLDKWFLFLGKKIQMHLQKFSFKKKFLQQKEKKNTQMHQWNYLLDIIPMEHSIG